MKLLLEEVRELAQKGYLQYVVNNPGHFSLFRDLENIRLIAGPWLYMFNSWALSFVDSLGVDAFVSPLENNRQNLERTLGKEKGIRKKFFIPVFAWPPLFNIRADLGSALGLGLFADNRDEAFSLVSVPGNAGEGARVYPNQYFSITDKIPFLKEAGFRRFIIDLCGTALKKSDYRDLMRSISENTPLPHSNRFNWKDGFFHDGNR